MIPGMKFDAYHATIPASVEDVEAEISRLYYTADFRPISGTTHGYEHIGGWFLGNIELARMYYGGNGGGVSVQCKGSGTPEFVKRLRIVFPDHSVSRCDVAFDVDYPGAWLELSGFGKGLASTHGLRLHENINHGHGDTVRVGGTSSVIYCRFYQKGKELFGPTASEDHVRVEVEIKPGNARAKKRAATMLPVAFFGAAKWSRELALHLGQIPVDAVKLGTVWRDPDRERARRSCAKQYGRTLQEWAEELGGASELLRTISEYAQGHYGEVCEELPEDEQEVLDTAWQRYRADA